MSPGDDCILAVNGGSSSVKFAVHERATLARVLAGRVEGSAGPGAEGLRQRLHGEGLIPRIRAVGHRIVHGGPRFHQPQRIDSQMLAELAAMEFYDPEHLPGELSLISSCQALLPDAVQVACFDTDFHWEMPRVARLLAVPRRWEDRGIRRYGFHGLSYRSLLDELSRAGGKGEAAGRVIMAHLGGGSSLAAARGGKPIDTTMGFTPTSGVPMATRSGDLDPEIAGYLARTEGLSAESFSRAASLESGLLGVSGTTGDMRELLRLETSDARAADAVALYCYEIRKRIGAYAAALGGIDTLVFAGGVGENSAAIRERICQGLEFLGIVLAAGANASHALLISPPEGPVKVRVLRTDEELVIARETGQIMDL